MYRPFPVTVRAFDNGVVRELADNKPISFAAFTDNATRRAVVMDFLKIPVILDVVWIFLK